MIRSMRCFLCCLVAAFLPLLAVAQTAPSAREAVPLGLNWDVTPTQVEETLKARGGKEMKRENRPDGFEITAKGVNVGGLNLFPLVTFAFNSKGKLSYAALIYGPVEPSRFDWLIKTLAATVSTKYGEQLPESETVAAPPRWRIGTGTEYETFIIVQKNVNGPYINVAYFCWNRGFAQALGKKAAPDF